MALYSVASALPRSQLTFAHHASGELLGIDGVSKWTMSQLRPVSAHGLGEPAQGFAPPAHVPSPLAKLGHWPHAAFIATACTCEDTWANVG